MKFFLAIIFSFSFFLKSSSQKLDETFNPVIKITPQQIKIVQSSDDGYLVYGDVDYYNESFSGSLIKIDELGNLDEGFQNVYTDRWIETVIVVQSGKILISGGFRYLNGEPVGGSALLNSDGSVDHSFNIEEGEWFRILGIQSSGNPIGISSKKNTPYTRIARLHPDGKLDASFSTNLSVTLFGSLAVSDDDKIYVTDLDRVHRLSQDGEVDPAYNFPVSQLRTVNSIAFQSDGKLLATVTKASSSTPPYTNTYTVERFSTDGTIDNTFTTGNADARIDFIDVRANGQIVVSGYLSTFDANFGNCMELNADGSFNRSLLNADFNGIYYMYIDKGQNIFISGGFKKVNGIHLKHVVKIKPTDEIDVSFKIPVFGVRGYLDTPLAAQSTDKLIIGGGSNFHGVGSNASKIVRILPDGGEDAEFLPTLTEHPLYNGFVNAIAVQEDNKVIVGAGNLFEDDMLTLRRFHPNGEEDHTFQIGSGPSFSGGVYRPATRFIKIRDSKIYVAGAFDRFNDTDCKSFVILDENGSRIGPEHNTLPANSYLKDMEIQSDGKIIFLGTFPLPESGPQNFLRLNSDGSIDTSFRLKYVQGGVADFEIDAYDNILVTGNSLDLKPDKILIRFTPDGDPDKSLDLGAGFVPTDQNFLFGYSVKALKNDMIAVSGIFSGYQNTTSPGLVILDYNGSCIPFLNPFDLTSYGYTSTYATNTLYVLGRFADKGTKVFSGIKMNFPDERSATSFKAKATSETSIELSWNPLKEDQFIIEYSSTPQSGFEAIATISSSAKLYEVKNLSEVTPYYFRIKSSNELPSAPAFFDGSDTTGIASQVALPSTDITAESFVANWVNIPGTDSLLLQVSDNNFAGFVNGYENLIVHGESKLINGLEDGKTYQYRVKRFKNNKSSPFSTPITANIITAIEEHASGVSVYPNPVTNKLYVKLPKNVSTAAITVRSMTGTVVGEYIAKNNDQAEIDVKNIPCGIFILTISSNGDSKNFKLIKTE